MFAAIRTKKNVPGRSATCRREASRHKVRPANVTCWSPTDAPTRVAAIEADSKGARLMLPWQVRTGESVFVSLGNEVGMFETRAARVVWTQTLEVSGRVVAGVAFDSEACLDGLALAV